MEDNKNNGYEKICCMCRRTENRAGKMITLPGGLNVCRDCMQRSFDMMMGSGMDWTKMSGITPEMLKNMYLNPMGSGNGAQKPENAGAASGKKDAVSGAEKTVGVSEAAEMSTESGNGTVPGDTGVIRKAEKQDSEDDLDEADGVNTESDEDNEQTVVDADETGDGDDFEEDGEEAEGIPLGNIFGIPVGQIDLGALMGQGHKRRKKKKKVKKELFKLSEIPAPHAIKAQLDEYVIGQEQAKKVIAVAVYNHYKRVFSKTSPDAGKYGTDIDIEKSNILMIGPTGSGKSTLVNLIARFYDATSGTIQIDGQNIQNYSQHDLREKIGVVPQRAVLFKGSIRENMKWGRENATDEEIIEAAKKAHAHKFIIQLKGGYDAMLAEEGSNLSQGQRQLLSIARIMLANPPMLILDEATSSIDTRTERQIQDAFDTMMIGRTTFIVAHRLSTIQKADQIIVMNDGHIIEQGKHEELLKKNGFYHNLYYSQFEKPE